MFEKDLIIIGAGPSGLKAGEEAARLGIDYMIIDKGDVGQAWREIRPSMPMLSPCHPQRDWTSISAHFPIWKLDVTRPFCTAEQFVNYLVEYAAHFNLQLQINSEVKEINSTADGFFDIRTQTDQIRSKVVLVTTGFFGNPYIPDIPGLQDNAIVSHSHFYKNPDEYRAKRVAIIGGGNSAAEIALELSGYSQVYLLTRDKLKFFSKTRNLCDIRGVSESLLLEMIRMEIIRHIEGIHVKKVENNKLIFESGCISADSIICATGYSAVLDLVHQLNAKVDPKTKFPSVSLNNESKNIPSLFF